MHEFPLLAGSSAGSEPLQLSSTASLVSEMSLSNLVAWEAAGNFLDKLSIGKEAELKLQGASLAICLF